MTRMQADAGRERSGAGRLGLVSGLLVERLAALQAPGVPPRVLDCGGGSGSYAVPLAVAGCDVTVIDISADALATLQRRADEAGVPALVHPLVGDVEALGQSVPPGAFDAVLAHGVLDALDSVEGTLGAMVAALRPGGLLSVVVANPVAAVLARALAGEPDLALRELRSLDTPGRLGPEVVERLCAEHGLLVEARHGVGVFSDLVPGAAADTPGARAAVRALDLEAATRAPFAQIAGRIHLLARRTGG